MARRSNRGERDTSDIAIDQNLMLGPVADLLGEPVDMRLVEDRRTWHPEQLDRPALTLEGLDALVDVVAPIKAPDGKELRGVPSGIGFVDPRRTVVCVRRRQRREVLFALRKTRRRGGGSRRRDWRSQVRC